MGRPKLINPTRALNTHLEERLMIQVDLLLWSEAENRVPKNSYQRFFNERIREFFGTRALDLSPYTGAAPGLQIIRAEPEVLEILRGLLEKK